MATSRAARRILATTALSTFSFAGFAGYAAAETPPHAPGVVIGIPDAEPDPPPEPTIPVPDLPVVAPTALPDPDPAPDLPLANPEVAPDPDPDPDPDPEPDPEPQIPTGADDLIANPCTVITHGCGDDPVDDFTATPADPGDPGDGEGEEPEGDPQDRAALPRTGAGLALIAGLGATFVAAGATARRAARR